MTEAAPVLCYYCKNEAVGKAEFLRTHRVYDLCADHLDTVAYQNPQAWKAL